MKSRFSTKCIACDEFIETGNEISKNKDGDWVHKYCVDEVLEMP